MDKLAYRIVSTDENGDTIVEYLDSQTNKPISDLNGYSVEDYPDDIEYPTDISGSSNGFLNSGKYDEELNLYRRDSDRGDKTPSNAKSVNRTAANNYGYYDKPRALELAKFAPGPIGMAAKAANIGVNLNNKVAVDTARDMLGLENKGFLSDVKGVVSDNKGYIGDVNIGDENYSVGFEALDPKGRTTLTPNEARMRSSLAGGLTELSKTDKKQAIKDFKADKKVETLSTVPSDKVGQDLRSNIFDMNSPTEGDYKENLARGMGLGDVSPSFRDRMENGINYSHAERGPVTSNLNERTVDTMNALAEQQPGGINVTSAYRSPAVNAAVGGAAQSMHSLGEAFDLSTKGLTDKQKRDLVERSIMSGAEEIGTYQDESLHIASRARFEPLEDQQTGGITGMYERSRFNLPNAPDWFKSGLTESQLAPTPTPKPDIPSYAIEENPDPVEEDTAFDKMSLSTPSFDRSTVTPEDRSLAAMTLAGEIDLGKTDLSTEVGRTEAMGILSTIENRAPKYGSISDAITAPNQYSTWSNQTATNTATKNYDLNKDLYDGLVNDYFDNPDTNLGFTSYHANYVNPGWSESMKNKQVIGPHTFGFLKEYQPKTTPVGTTTTLNTPASAAPTVSSGIMSAANTNTQSNRPTNETTGPTTSETKDRDLGGTNSTSNSNGHETKDKDKDFGNADQDKDGPY